MNDEQEPKEGSPRFGSGVAVFDSGEIKKPPIEEELKEVAPI